MKDAILITGASGSLGRAIALELADLGHPLALHCRGNRARAEALQAELEARGARARVLQFDVTDRDGTRQALEADLAAHGAYYGVVVNAGLTRDKAFPALTGEDWDLVLRTNLDGFFNVVHPLTMPMIRRRKPGRIVAIASVAGMIGNRGQVNYSASKGGLIAAAKALAFELATREITVNCVAPGLIESEMAEAVIPEAMQEIIKLIPMKRLGKPVEVAAAVKYLMSENAAYVTRQVLSINGGLC